MPRAEAVRAARRAGAIVQTGTSATTNVVVRGRPNSLQAAGKDGGRKLMEIKRLAERGIKISLIGEAQFWRLVGRRLTLAHRMRPFISDVGRALRASFSRCSIW